ncbi:ATP-binding protein [Paludicola sp. MB14-C6]|uniref:ATP-binding protein n=1 Tax=Paludihabitans sp. MB14-C6 TaxID=3070656 RepID=UPI0027DE535D|nr:ATP-binding protein [Paludicola sp. MB14-C6]WMJ23419.1 ATP-binding protein [Paludicola sp. MB14-C6]
MQELSLNILDVAQNSIKAKATLITIKIHKNTMSKTLLISIEDNGCGMSQQQAEQVVDPFYTTRTTRKVGLGVPFFKMSAELTGGTFTIQSELKVGTKISALYYYEHIDMMPVGDMASTMLSLISVNPDIDFIYYFSVDENEFCMNTQEMKTVLEGLPVNSNEVLTFIKNFINENQAEIENSK